jgi:BASS family bile acid:Na+ symporter
LSAPFLGTDAEQLADNCSAARRSGHRVEVLLLMGGLLAWLWPMEPALAVGLVIVAICPGGPSSNLITYLAKGDVALSVTLTAISSVVTVFTIPVLANLALQLLMGSGSGSPQQR